MGANTEGELRRDFIVDMVDKPKVQTKPTSESLSVEEQEDILYG